uniref:Exocyst complex component 1 like n=2 Tax=Phasianidae TaxID=9005 RepID=A0A8C9FDS9_PAVCR
MLVYKAAWGSALPSSCFAACAEDVSGSSAFHTNFFMLKKSDLLHSTQLTKSEEVEICMVKHFRDREEKYEVVEKWFLKDLEMIDGKEADTDNPYFDMHFHKVYSMEAYSCASKYTFARTLSNLNEMYLKKDLKIVNFDSTYLNDDSIWSSNNRDCLVLMRICFYASNLLCLSLCPLS